MKNLHLYTFVITANSIYVIYSLVRLEFLSFLSFIVLRQEHGGLQFVLTLIKSGFVIGFPSVFRKAVASCVRHYLC